MILKELVVLTEPFKASRIHTNFIYFEVSAADVCCAPLRARTMSLAAIFHTADIHIQYVYAERVEYAVIASCLLV